MTYRTRIPLLALFALLFGLVAGGCGSMARGLGNMTGNKYAKADSGLTWNTPAPEMEPPLSGRRTVYLSQRDISGQGIQIAEELRQGVEAIGYQVVADPSAANYRLRATIRYFGENEALDGGSANAAAMGTIAGAAVGVGTGVGIYQATGSGLGGVVGGGVVGGLTGIALANNSRPREWNLIVDIILEEKLAQPIEVSISTGSARMSNTGSTAGSSGAGMQLDVASGGASDQTVKGASMKTMTDFFPHGIRVTSWARQMNMNRQEALPLIRERIAGVIPNLLPV